MKKAIRFYVLFGVIVATLGCKAQSNKAFYKPSATHNLTKNLVKDYQVDNDFDTDDSEQLQKAINQISKNGGGKLIIPKGNYSFENIKVLSNVHLEFDPESVVRPTLQANQKNFSIFSFGKESATVKNISVTSSDPKKKFIIDLTHTNNTNVAVFALKNIENFLFSNILIKDIQTKFSSFTFAITPHNNDYYFPHSGIIKNCETTNADYGYGLIQVQAAKNVLFENLGGQGGVTLRLETGLTKMNNVQKGGVHDIIARNIECHDGNAGVMISPHAMHNGIVTIDGVTTVNCGFGVRIGGGFISKKYNQNIGLTKGKFDPRSSLKNVIATFGTKAQVKPKHHIYIPRKFQTKENTADTPITNVHSNPKSNKKSHSVFAVSVAAVGYFSARGVECKSKNEKIKKLAATYTINIDESTIKAIGFTDQKPIIDLTDDVRRVCSYLK